MKNFLKTKNKLMAHILSRGVASIETSRPGLAGLLVSRFALFSIFSILFSASAFLPQTALANYQFIPTAGNIVTGTNQHIDATLAPSADTSLGSYKALLADDTRYWGATSTVNGIDMEVTVGNVTLNGANKLIVQTDIDLDATVPALYLQVCDWSSSASIDNVADANCTGGGWRTVNSRNASNVSIAYTDTAGDTLQWHIYNGYFATTTSAGGVAVNTPLENFVNGSNQMLFRYYATSSATTAVAVDFLRVFAVVDPIYQASGFTNLGSGVPTGTYHNTVVIGNTGTAQLTTAGDALHLVVPGTAGSISDFYLSFGNVETYTGMNTILVNTESLCSAATADLSYKFAIRNFTAGAWEDMSGPIDCSLTAVFRTFARNNVSNINDYIASGEIRIRVYGSMNSVTSIQLDQIYVMPGTTNTDVNDAEVSFGTTTAGRINENPSIGEDQVNAIATDSTHMYLAGYDSFGTDNRWRLEKRKLSDGSLVSAFGTDGVITADPAAFSDQILAIATTSDAIFLAGFDSISATDSAWRVEKRDITTGALVAAFGTNGVLRNSISARLDRIRAIVVDGTDIYIAGDDLTTGTTDAKWRIEKHDITTGATTTAFATNGVYTYDPANTLDVPYALALDGAGNLFVAGGASTTGSLGWNIQKLAISNGALVTAFSGDGILTDTNPSANIDEAFAMVLSTSTVFVTGEDRTVSSANSRWLTQAYNITTGATTTSWGTSGAAVLNPSATLDAGRAMAINGDAIYVAGYDASAQTTGIARIIKYDLFTGATSTVFNANGTVMTQDGNEDKWQAIALDGSYMYLGGFSNAPVSGDDQWMIEKRDKVTGLMASTTFGMTGVAATRDIDMTASTTNSWNIQSEDETAALSHDYYALDNGVNNATIEEAAAANIGFSVTPPTDSAVTSIMFAGRYMAGAGGTTQLTIKDYSGIATSYTGTAEGGWSLIGTTATINQVYTDPIVVGGVGAGGVHGWNSNPGSYIDTVGNEINLRLPFTTGSASSTNTTMMWDFAFVSLQWTEDPDHPTRRSAFIPTAGTTTVGTNQTIDATLGATADASFGSYKALLADDTRYWGATSTTPFSVASQASSPSGVFFKSDGTKMYVVQGSGMVYQYSLSIAWNSSTASYDSVSFDTTAQSSFLSDIFFKSDGTKMYLLDEADGTLFQYSLTAWDLSTASYDNVSFSVASQEALPTGIFFKSDGTKMYIVGNINDTVYQYSLSTPWVVSSASYASLSKSVTTQDIVPSSLAFKSDGTKMFMLGFNNDTVYQYSLSNAWDVSTSTYDNVSFSVTSHDTSPTGLFLKSDGTEMYVTGDTNNKVYQYEVQSAWDLRSAAGIAMEVTLDNVVLNEANKLIIQTDIDLDAPAPNLLFQICDWRSASSTDAGADTNCTGGGWRTLNSRTAANVPSAYTDTAGDTLQWHIYDGYFAATTSAPVTNSWTGITYGNGLFVTVAIDGTNRVMTSSDGITWTPRNAAEANQWFSVTYGNGLFVAVSNDGTNRVMTSPDGIAWTAQSAAEANSWVGITYGNGLFVAVAESGTNRVMTSPDGITWTPRSASEANTWASVTYGNGLFVTVAIDGTNRVMTSSDGITWTPRNAAEANTWASVTYGNGLFVTVAIDGTNRVMTSPDGITWTARSASEANTWTSVTYGNGLFVAVSSDGTNRVMTSPDGITWTARPAGGSEFTGVTYGNGTFVAVALLGTHRVMTSSDGITWYGNGGTPISTPLTNFVNNSNQMLIRYLANSASLSPIAVDFLRVFAVVDPLYQASGFVNLGQGAPAGTYANTYIIGNIAAGPVSIAGDSILLAVPGTASSISDFYLSFKNVKTYAGMNTVLVNSDSGCSAATADLKYTFAIRNFTTSTWEDISGAIDCTAATEAVYTFARNNISNIYDYVSDGEIRIRVYGSANSTTNLRIDYMYVTLGTTNTDSADAEVSFGSATAGRVSTNPSTGSDQIQAMATDNTYMYLAGFDTLGGDNEWRLEKRNLSDGSLVSAFGTGGVVTSDPSSTIDQILSIATTTDAVFLAGYDSVNSNNAWRVEKRDINTGALVSAFGSSGVLRNNLSAFQDRIYAIVADSTDLYLIGEDRIAGTSDAKWRVQKHDITTGATTTAFATNGVYTYNPASVNDIPRAAALDGAGNLFVAGEAQTSNNLGWNIQKLSTADGSLVTAFSGNGILDDTNPSSNTDQAFAIALSGSDLFVSGYDATVSAANTRWLTQKYSATTGATTTGWAINGAASFDGSTLLDAVTSLTTDGAALYAAGYDSSLAGSFRLIKYDLTTGATSTAFNALGTVRADDAGDDHYNAVAVVGSSLYLAGYGTGAGVAANNQWIIEKRDKTTGLRVSSGFPATTGAVNTRDIDTTASSTNTWDIQSEDETTAMTHDFYAFDNGASNSTAEEAASANITFAVTTPTDASITSAMYAGRFLAGGIGVGVAQLSLKDYSGISPTLSANNLGGWSSIGVSSAGLLYTDPVTVGGVGLGGFHGFNSNAASYIDMTDNKMNLRLPFTTTSASSTNATMMWDFAMAGIQWTESGTPILSQAHYRWRADDGSESAATYLATEDNASTTPIYKGDRVRLRMLLSNTGAGSVRDLMLRLEYSSGACTTWSAVPTIETYNVPWVMDLSQYVVNGAAATNVAGLTDPGSKTFVSGRLKSSINAWHAHALTLSRSQFTEYEYVLRSTSFATQNTVQYCFRLTNNGSATNFSYSVIPKIMLGAGTTFMRPQSGGGALEGSGAGALVSGGGAGGGSEPETPPTADPPQSGGSSGGGGGLE